MESSLRLVSPLPNPGFHFGATCSLLDLGFVFSLYRCSVLWLSFGPVPSLPTWVLPGPPLTRLLSVSAPLWQVCVCSRARDPGPDSYFGPRGQSLLEFGVGTGAGLRPGGWNHHACKGHPGRWVLTPAPILQMSKLRPKEVEGPARDHPESSKQSWGSLLPRFPQRLALPALPCRYP